jgi:hypothetical protein
MLQAVLAAEKKAGADYTEPAREAETFGDKGLMVQLEDMVRDETGHSEETERILRDRPLERQSLQAVDKPGQERDDEVSVKLHHDPLPSWRTFP